MACRRVQEGADPGMLQMVCRRAGGHQPSPSRLLTSTVPTSSGPTTPSPDPAGSPQPGPSSHPSQEPPRPQKSVSLMSLSSYDGALPGSTRSEDGEARHAPPTSPLPSPAPTPNPTPVLGRSGRPGWLPASFLLRPPAVAAGVLQGLNNLEGTMLSSLGAGHPMSASSSLSVTKQVF